MSDVVCAIDIGSANVRFIIAQRMDDDSFQFVGVGTSFSQ